MDLWHLDQRCLHFTVLPLLHRTREPTGNLGFFVLLCEDRGNKFPSMCLKLLKVIFFNLPQISGEHVNCAGHKLQKWVRLHVHSGSSGSPGASGKYWWGQEVAGGWALRTGCDFPGVIHDLKCWNTELYHLTLMEKSGKWWLFTMETWSWGWTNRRGAHAVSPCVSLHLFRTSCSVPWQLPCILPTTPSPPPTPCPGT